MDLLDSYLKAVKRYLPRGQHNDIVAELAEDIRSQMEEKELELGCRLSENEQMDVLKEHGDPLTVALRYRQERRSLAVGWELISPELFPAFVLHLCINVTVTIAAVTIFLLAGRYPFTLQPFVIPVLTQLVCVPLVYIILNVFRHKVRPYWLFAPAALSRLMPIARLYSLSGLICCGLLTLWWMAVLRFPFLVFGPAAASLKLTPVWQKFYLPVLLLLLAAVAQRATNLVRPQWTWLLPVARLFINGIGAAVAYLIFSSHTLVLAADHAQSAAHNELAQTWNAWLLWGLFGPWLSIYLGITAIVYAWYCVPHLRQWVGRAHTPNAGALNGIV